MTPTSRRLRIVAVLVAAASSWPAMGAAQAVEGASDRIDEAQAQQEQVRQQQGIMAGELDALAATNAEIERALGDLAARVAVERTALAEANGALERAKLRIEWRGRQQDRASQEIGDLEGRLREAAVFAFMDQGSSSQREESVGPDVEGMRGVEGMRVEVLAEAVAVDVDASVQEVGRQRRRLVVAQGEAQRAAIAVQAHQEEVEARLGELRRVQRDQQDLLLAVDQRIEARLSEAAALAQVDQELSLQIVAEQERLAKVTARRQRKALARARAAAASASIFDSASGSGSSVRLGPPPPLASAGGITVRADLAEALAALLDAARRAGVPLAGWGYRDSAAQWRLRVAHCADPASTPAGRCSPPTARVGQSMHERGLAIDFTYNGRIIPTRASPAYRWLAANAARYGLHNLPSEPWHWSVNGH